MRRAGPRPSYTYASTAEGIRSPSTSQTTDRAGGPGPWKRL